MKPEIPIWFLDIDSTINIPPPYSYDTGNNVKKRLRMYPTWEKIVIQGYNIMYSPVVIDFINRMHHAGLAEIQWLTTWKHLANTDFSPAVGLPEFKVADGGGSDFIYPHENWWKYRTVEHSANVRPFVWTDDDITKEAKRDILEYGSRDGYEGLVIVPAVSRALEPMHLEQIETFLLEQADKRRKWRDA